MPTLAYSNTNESFSRTKESKIPHTSKQGPNNTRHPTALAEACHHFLHLLFSMCIHMQIAAGEAGPNKKQCKSSMFSPVSHKHYVPRLITHSTVPRILSFGRGRGRGEKQDKAMLFAMSVHGC
ncbi:unnamed protein product [Periconia digitata]|uniref:Uncharacterized protein n=1 Tax=Periconia digitata TaxID=1303443 RepID=A0A9W4UBI5_9PLEO|nr:unnamed protein product [Periconia digitata]